MTATILEYDEQEDGCWLWLGYVDAGGYGRVYDRAARMIKWVHRYSYEVHKGPIAPRHDIDHLCQNTRCINPDHLDQVTRSEHVRRTLSRLGKDDLHLTAARLRQQGHSYEDIAARLGLAGRESAFSAVESAVAKGLVPGDQIPRRRLLTDDDRASIRGLYAAGMRQKDIAARFGIDSSQVSRIVNGKRRGWDSGIRGGIDLRYLRQVRSHKRRAS